MLFCEGCHKEFDANAYNYWSCCSKECYREDQKKLKRLREERARTPPRMVRGDGGCPMCTRRQSTIYPPGTVCHESCVEPYLDYLKLEAGGLRIARCLDRQCRKQYFTYSSEEDFCTDSCRDREARWLGPFCRIACCSCRTVFPKFPAKNEATRFRCCSPLCFLQKGIARGESSKVLLNRSREVLARKRNLKLLLVCQEIAQAEEIMTQAVRSIAQERKNHEQSI